METTSRYIPEGKQESVSATHPKHNMATDLRGLLDVHNLSDVVAGIIHNTTSETMGKLTMPFLVEEHAYLGPLFFAMAVATAAVVTAGIWFALTFLQSAPPGVAELKDSVSALEKTVAEQAKELHVLRTHLNDVIAAVKAVGDIHVAAHPSSPVNARVSITSVAAASPTSPGGAGAPCTPKSKGSTA